ncbi:MAG: hypothetical protein COA42_18785 [Alteromonadaceae bacterium]|nr:MAG: hypothetical protein COA42_18785 [Alteromonadaceae bacterium]
MKVVIYSFFILLCSNYAQASWSKFALVTPESETVFGLKVLMSPIENKPGTYTIKLKAVGYNHKHAWLIISQKKLSPSEQQLREYIWQGSKTKQDILVKAKLMPTGIGGLAEKEEVEKFYVVELDSKLIERSYIYIDFPSLVFDGGYYYSIALGAYYKNLASGANKPLKAMPKDGAP